MKLHIIAAMLLLLGGGMLHAQPKISVDPASVTGPIKRMNAANNGPVDENMVAYKALRIPYARTHDTPLGSSYGVHLIDINAVFPDFKANPDKPGSYDFTNSDVVLLDMQKAGTRPFYRLGQSIEHHKKKYGVYPPADFKKWAKICEHIIRHYNEGWADGFHMGIEYWEIWNEPDLDQPDDRWKTDPRTWAGTMEQFNSLYIITAKHLKKCFPNLKIGGPAMANPRRYGPDFLDAVGAAGAPLDFFSWHMYHRRPVRVSEDVRIIRELLDEKGFKETESILNEWNYVRSWDETDFYSKRVRASVKGAAFVAGVMIECQNAPLDMLMYYDLRPGTSYNGAFAPYVYEIWPSYWPLYYWAELVDYGTQVSSSCDVQNIYTCAAESADGNSIRLLVARYHKDDDPVAPCELGIDLPAGWQVSLVRMTDSKGLDRKLSSGSTLTLESNAIALVEISRANVTFEDLPEDISIETIGNRVAEQFLAADPLDYGNNLPGYQAPYNYGRGGKEMNYSVVSLWVNAIEFAHRSHNEELEKRLIDFFEPFYGERKSKRNRDNHVDFSIFGAIPLEIYLMNGDKRALELGLRYADHQWEDPIGEPGKKVGGNGNFPIERQRELLAEGYSPQTRLWIDDMYMITVLQTQAYRATGDRKYIDRAAREMKMYMDSLQRENGLFYHAPEAPYFWGRGNGWMAAGLPMLLAYLPKDSEYRPALKEAYLKMMPTLLKYQHENGMWGQVIDDPEFWEETSCTAMFAYAFIEGVRQGLLDEAAYAPAARKAWVSLCGKLDEHANLADVCIGTDRRNSREWYMDRPRSNGDPHGQMAMMWLCNVLLK